MLCAAATSTLLHVLSAVALVFGMRACRSIGNLQCFQAVNEIGHFYCQGLEQWTAPDNNSADFFWKARSIKRAALQIIIFQLVADALNPNADVHAPCSQGGSTGLDVDVAFAW